ncbi:VanZ family protein [Microbacterium lacus]|uniref:VanZ family protein n=1 Tax=Microbacterium lacus TaxID=415217 RepID=UPI000C2C5ECD|nr:VanZ family protein [Microbacterium lacus]
MALVAALLVAVGTLLTVGLWPYRVDDSRWVTLTLENLHMVGVPRWVDYTLVERLANTAIYIPLGVVLVMALGRRYWWAALILAVVTSLIIEAGQTMLDERVASPIDVVMNVLGALAGIACAMALGGPRVRRP